MVIPDELGPQELVQIERRRLVTVARALRFPHRQDQVGRDHCFVPTIEALHRTLPLVQHRDSIFDELEARITNGSLNERPHLATAV